MRLVLISALLMSLLFLFAGCSKDDEIENLENEIRSSESADLLADKESDTALVKDSAAKEMALTPEKMPAEEKRKKPTMPVNDLSGYTVQVAAGTDYNRALEAVQKFEDRGYENVFIVNADIDGQTFYRVRIGAFESLADAKALGKELKDKYSVNYWIDIN